MAYSHNMTLAARGAALASVMVAVLGVVATAAAEEFHLKDGSKIVGTVVGYEKDAFRVETSFGVAIIYKDRILRIVFPESSGAKSTAPETEKAPPPEPEPEPAPAPPEPKPTKQETPPRPTPPAPRKIVEHVSTTEYVNETYHFRMFKPPTWRSYPHLVKPQNPLVAALGTPDETTLLLIGREGYRGSLVNYVRLAERSLRQFYQDYNPQGQRPTQVAGLQAVERRFTGSAEGRYWSGLAFYFARGGQQYTLLGVTAAGETASFQHSVLRKVVNSLQFLPD